MRVGTIIVAVLHTTVAHAQAPLRAVVDTTRWSPALSMQYRGVSGVDLSPDGRLLAYVVRNAVMTDEQSEYLSHVWVAAVDGSFNVQYTQGEHSANAPKFSPSGEHLAFTSARSGTTQVWVMRVRGGEAEQVTEAEGNVTEFGWSPDGGRIAYLMVDPDPEPVKTAKREKSYVTVVDQDFRYAHLYTVRIGRGADGGRDTRRLTSGPLHVTSFNWSPDGKTLVFAHKSDPTINNAETDISMVPADSGAVRSLVSRPGSDADPCFSPNGDWVAFTSHGGQPERVGLSDVWVIAVGGGPARKLADTPDRNANLIGWSADGARVYVLEAVHTSRQLMELPLGGGRPRIVTAEPGVFGSFAFDGGGVRAAFTYENTDTPPDIYVAQVGRWEKRRVTDLHAAVPKPVMGRTEVLTWSAPDGRRIEGLLTYPVHYAEGRRYPLVLNVHGGPAGVYTQSFTGSPSIYMIQTFAQEGYAVLRPNPRGSTGYGKEFRYANVRDWGYGDYEDLMSGVDRVVQMGVAHADSLLLMGWSYGGYMTSFAVTRTERFRAASMGAGLPNLVSMVTTTDIPDYLAAHMGSEVWEDYETYEKHSAMYRIANVTTPTQVIHGENDDRVPLRQGQEFYVALKRRGVPTEMIVLPRTPHGPREPRLLMGVTEHILRWFETHLARKKVTTTTEQGE